MASVPNDQTNVVIVCELQTRLHMRRGCNVDGVLDIRAQNAGQLADLKRVTAYNDGQCHPIYTFWGEM